MRNEIVQLGIDDAPERALLGDSRSVLAVQERDVQHFFSLVASSFADAFVLKERVLNVAVFFELLHVYVSFSYRGPPAVVGQGNAVAKTFDTALKHLELDVLDLQVLFELTNELLCFCLLVVGVCWTMTFLSLAESAPRR